MVAVLPFTFNPIPLKTPEFFQFPALYYACLYTVNNFLCFLLIFMVDFSR